MLAHFPLLLLIIPVAILFLGIVADPEETHAVWYGMLNTLSGLQDRPRSPWHLLLPLFVFMPKLIQRGMKADADAVIEAFGKNEQVKKVFWTLFVAMTGLVMARVVDPMTAQQVVGIITGMGV